MKKWTESWIEMVAIEEEREREKKKKGNRNSRD